MDNRLVDKIVIDKGYLSELVAKTWHDIEGLQSQIASLNSEDSKTAEVKKLLNNLLTSYYVFTGCAENILTDFDSIIIDKPVQSTASDEMNTSNNEIAIETDSDNFEVIAQNEYSELEVLPEDDDFEPFEYFVDFDEPVGEKITDEDLYNI